MRSKIYKVGDVVKFNRNGKIISVEVIGCNNYYNSVELVTREVKPSLWGLKLSYIIHPEEILS